MNDSRASEGEGKGLPVTEPGRAGQAQLLALTARSLPGDPSPEQRSAFPPEDRLTFGLPGLLPPRVSLLEEQMARPYGNDGKQETDIERRVFLAGLRDSHEPPFHAPAHKPMADALGRS